MINVKNLERLDWFCLQQSPSTTGAYSACLAAILFFIPFRFAFFAISLGVVIAGGGVALMIYLFNIKECFYMEERAAI